MKRSLWFLAICSLGCDSATSLDVPAGTDYLVILSDDGSYKLVAPTGLIEISPPGRVFAINIPYEFDYLAEPVDTDSVEWRLPSDTVVHQLTQAGFTATGTAALADLRLPSIPHQECWLQNRCVLSDTCAASCEVSAPLAPAPPDYKCPIGWAPEFGLGVMTASCRHPSYEAVAGECGPNEILVGGFADCAAVTAELGPNVWPEISESTPLQTFRVRPGASGPCGVAPAECELDDALAHISGMSGAIGLALSPGLHRGRTAAVEPGTRLFVYGAGTQTTVEDVRWFVESGAEISIKQVLLRTRQATSAIRGESRSRASIEDTVVECDSDYCVRTDGEFVAQHSLLTKNDSGTVPCVNVDLKPQDVRCLPAVFGSATSTVTLRDSELASALGVQTRGMLMVSGSRFRPHAPDVSSVGLRTSASPGVEVSRSAFVGVWRALELAGNVEGGRYDIDDLVIRPISADPVRGMLPGQRDLRLGIALWRNDGTTKFRRIYVRGVDEGFVASASDYFEVQDSTFINLGTAVVISDTVERNPILIENTWLGTDRGTPIVLYEEAQLQLRDVIVAAYNKGEQTVAYATDGATDWYPEPVVLGTATVRPETSVPTLLSNRTAFEVTEQTVFRGYINLNLVDTDVELSQAGSLKRFMINTWELPVSGARPITHIEMERVEFRSRFATSWIEAGDVLLRDFVIKVDSPRGAPLCVANPVSLTMDNFRVELSVPPDQSEVVWGGFVSKMLPTGGVVRPDDSFPVSLRGGVLAGPVGAFDNPFQRPVLCDSPGIDPALDNVRLDRVQGRAE